MEHAAFTPAAADPETQEDVVPLDRSTARRITLIVLCSVGTVSVAGLGAGDFPSVRPAAALLPDTLAFEVEYGGIGAEGVDLIWRGRAGGRLPGQVTIRMEYAGVPGDRSMPVWPVNLRLFYSADDYRGSFAAELTGSTNWRTGETRVSGIVSDGARRDAPIEQRLQLHRPGLGGSATVVFLPRLALLDALAGGF
jgi:hypothetical protein